jgi:hypothetical protein
MFDRTAVRLRLVLEIVDLDPDHEIPVVRRDALGGHQLCDRILVVEQRNRDLDHMHPLLRPQQTFDPIEP